MVLPFYELRMHGGGGNLLAGLLLSIAMLAALVMLAVALLAGFRSVNPNAGQPPQLICVVKPG